LKVYGNTDKGLKRAMNQDTFYFSCFSPQLAYAVVCDGMGGENSGNVASQMTRDIVKKTLNDQIMSCNINEETAAAMVLQAIAAANTAVYTKSCSDSAFSGMGTTIVLALVVGTHCFIAHVGDSRAYLVGGGTLQQLTVDHSLVQYLYDKGKLSAEEMATHPDKNKITRAVGVEPTVDVDLIEVDFTAGQALLLCSDGLTNMCSDAEILHTICSHEGKQIPIRLIQQANAAGGNDNITAALIDKR
jgi:protein phosphatase